jgi:hypothetical protein
LISTCYDAQAEFHYSHSASWLLAAFQRIIELISWNIMKVKMSRVRLGIVAIVALTLTMVMTVSMTAVGVSLFPVGERTPSPDMWMDKYRAEDVWRVLVNGFASANPDYGVSFLDSRRDEPPVSSQGGELRLVLSPMPGILGNDLRFESSMKLLADGSVETPRLTLFHPQAAWATRWF